MFSPSRYDGLLYATRSFVFVRNALAIGVLLIFAPGLAVAKLEYSHSIVAIWVCKVGLNCWRCVSALFRVHWQLWPTWTEQPSADCSSYGILDSE
jgi:hypothetical protein